MKFKLLLVALLLAVFIIPTTVNADAGVMVESVAGPDTIQDGGDFTIYITVTNNTIGSITINQYTIYDTIFPIQPMVVSSGGVVTVPHEVTDHQFYGNDETVFTDISIGYETVLFGNTASYNIYGNDVIVSKADDPIDLSVAFDLAPDQTTVEEGNWVNYTISCGNIGNVDYESFKVSMGGQVVETFDLAIGETRIVFCSGQYFESKTEVFGYDFDYSTSSGMAVEYDENAFMVDITVTPAGEQQPVGMETVKPGEPNIEETPGPDTSQNNDGSVDNAGNDSSDDADAVDDAASDDSGSDDAIDDSDDAEDEEIDDTEDVDVYEDEEVETRDINMPLLIIIGLAVIGLFVATGLIIGKKMKDKN